MMEALPHNEAIEDALRVSIGMFPRIAVRELIANAMIHQDFAPGGTGPMIEFFDDRLEIQKPGLPLIDTLRFIDHSPRSRNERLADLMQQIGICEERGSGIDKVSHRDLPASRAGVPDRPGDDDQHSLRASPEGLGDDATRPGASVLSACLPVLRGQFRDDQRELEKAAVDLREQLSAGLQDPRRHAERETHQAVRSDRQVTQARQVRALLGLTSCLKVLISEANAAQQPARGCRRYMTST